MALNNDITAGWSELPSILINVVFAALFMKKIPRFKLVWEELQQTVGIWPNCRLGSVCCWVYIGSFFLGPLLSLPDVYAGVMPVGFEGGHGTAAGMKPVLNR